MWDQFLHMELTHLQLWADMMRKYEGRDPAELFGETLTVEFKFQENKEYIRRVLEQHAMSASSRSRWMVARTGR